MTSIMKRGLTSATYRSSLTFASRLLKRLEINRKTIFAVVISRFMNSRTHINSFRCFSDLELEYLLCSYLEG